MSSSAAQRTVTFPPRPTHKLPMGVLIAERITEQQQTRESLARTPLVALSLGKVSQHLIIAEHQAETLTEKLALGTYLCGDNRALLDEALECAMRVVGALSFCKKKALDHEIRVLAENEEQESQVLRESDLRPSIPAAEIDGESSFNRAPAPDERSGMVWWNSLSEAERAARLTPAIDTVAKAWAQYKRESGPGRPSFVHFIASESER